jgi:hypothetical protein
MAVVMERDNIDQASPGNHEGFQGVTFPRYADFLSSTTLSPRAAGMVSQYLDQSSIRRTRLANSVPWA